LESICQFVTQAAHEAGLDEAATYAVQLAVDEAATNIIEHAYQNSGEGVIECSYLILGDGLEITLVDHGIPFDPDAVPTPELNVPLEDLKPRGMGIYMMRKVMDEVRFEFSPQSNKLTLVKKKT